ncbi:ATP-NAD kinase-like domain-containing protein [Myxozyma melibiosi]|uniref:ATP-NAD kinase-like domain-containing protein n=1 Tax=Myxozyma melibiosi TaxID=54550 RepID=A0ABR1FDL0_9ASCO
MKFEAAENSLEGVGDDGSAVSIPFTEILALTSNVILTIPEGSESSLRVYSYKALDVTDEIKKYYLNELPPYLDPRSANVTVINSANAGARTGEAVYTSLLRPLFKELGVVHEYILTESKSSIQSFAGSLVPESGPHTIVILSGDTSIHELINSLRPISEATDLTILPIPTGSGNALMTSLDLGSPTSAMFSMLHGSVRPLRPFYGSFPPGSKEVIPPTDDEPDGLTRIFALVVVSWAIHAALVGDSDSPEYRKLGNDRFKIAAKENLERGAAWHGKLSYVSSSGGKLEPVELEDLEHSYVLTTSISSLEPGFKIAPTAKPLSGSLELVRLPFSSGEEIMRVLMLAYQDGAHVGEPGVLYTEIESLRVEMGDSEERMRRWCVDGRIVIVPLGATVEVHSGVENVRGWNVYIVA